ncbi:MAG: ATP-binding protein [Bacilli bacterium]|nr:ATP-binding protein [Bacilli bacterium]
MEKMKLPKIKFGDDISDLQKQAIEGLKNDEPVYKVIHDDLKLSTGQVRESLATLLDYQEDFHYCENCPGFEACNKANPHYEMSLAVNDGFVTRNFSACRVVRKLVDYESRFIVRDFPAEWQDVNMKTIDKTGKRRSALEALVKIATKKSNKWVYLIGSHGSGKSYILATFANVYAKDNKGCAFCDTSTLVDRLKDLQINAKKDFDERFEQLVKCPLLVLDDFGNEYKTEFVFASILFPLLNLRAKENLPTCFASDFTIEEIASMYAPKIGAVRAKQFKNLLATWCGKELDVTGINVY